MMPAPVSTNDMMVISLAVELAASPATAFPVLKALSAFVAYTIPIMPKMPPIQLHRNPNIVAMMEAVAQL